ncbi:hypothetical protein ACIP2X_18850 [Streptomyces sp. NPDC089424]|uniref:hypothetical protein n=1 Tax=Streptomyces sp. NPDC089424 TaxID=3365917 RepID=UPI0037FC633C
MQMPAALYLVPDPDDEQPPAPDTAGEQHLVPEPATAPATELEPAEEQHDTPDPEVEQLPAPDATGEQHPVPEPAPAPAAEPETEEKPDTGDELVEDLHDEEDEEDDEGDTPRRALAMPDLRPYSDVAALPQVITAGVTATRRARAQQVQRREGRPGRLLAIAVDVVAGSVMLLGHGAAWLRGEYGPASVKGPGRLGLAFLSGYFAYRTVDTWPLYGTAGIGVVWLGAALGERHRQRAQAAEKKTKGKGPNAGAKGNQDGDEQAAARRSWWSRITSSDRPHAEPADTPDEEPAEAAGDCLDEPEEEAPAEAPAEPPAEPPASPTPEAIAGALHHLYRGGSGVLLTTLRQHLSQPHTRAVRKALSGAGIQVRAGVRTPDGNGPGVHTNDFPPPPPSPDPAPGDAVVAGQEPTTTMPTPEEGPQKGLGVDGTYWPAGRPYHFEPHPDNPDRTVIVHHHDEG